MQTDTSEGRFFSLNFSLVWRCMLGIIFLHRFMEFNQKISLNIGLFFYDFWVSVCLELSVWSCLFGVLTDTLESKSSILRFFYSRCLFGAVCLFVCTPVCRFVSLRVRFRAQARGILNGHLRQGRARPLRRCLLESIFLHGLEEY